RCSPTWASTRTGRCTWDRGSSAERGATRRQTMKKRAITWTGVVAAALSAGCATTANQAYYDSEATAMIQRDFHARGIATMDRLKQDELQLACTQHRDRLPADLEKRLAAAQLSAIKLPADGKLMGDWKQGQRIAGSGRGMTWSDKAGVPSGGSCYNCH